jgi:hypothetical protein
MAMATEDSVLLNMLATQAQSSKLFLEQRAAKATPEPSNRHQANLQPSGHLQQNGGERGRKGGRGDKDKGKGKAEGKGKDKSGARGGKGKGKGKAEGKDKGKSLAEGKDKGKSLVKRHPKKHARVGGDHDVFCPKCEPPSRGSPTCRFKACAKHCRELRARQEGTTHCPKHLPSSDDKIHRALEPPRFRDHIDLGRVEGLFRTLSSWFLCSQLPVLVSYFLVPGSGFSGVLVAALLAASASGPSILSPASFRGPDIRSCSLLVPAFRPAGPQFLGEDKDSLEGEA